MLGIGSDGDEAFPANCMVKAVEQALHISNRGFSGSQDARLALTPPRPMSGRRMLARLGSALGGAQPTGRR
jgi:hypothetical protein